MIIAVRVFPASGVVGKSGKYLIDNAGRFTFTLDFGVDYFSNLVVFQDREAERIEKYTLLNEKIKKSIKQL